MAYKLISTDIDDTIIPFGNLLLSDQIITSFKKAKEKGIYIIPNSGRSLFNLPPNMKDADIDYAICCNGAAIYNYKTKQRIHSAGIEMDRALKILSFLKENEIPYFCFCETGAITNAENYDYIANMPNNKSLMLALTKFDDFPKAVIENKILLLKIIALFEKDSPRRKPITEMIYSKFDHLRITSSNPYNLEINDISANKAIGLSKLCEYLNIDTADTIAIGDNNNDIEVLNVAGLAVVVANGTPAAKECADVLIDSCCDDGVSNYIEQLLD